MFFLNLTLTILLSSCDSCKASNDLAKSSKHPNVHCVPGMNAENVNEDEKLVEHSPLQQEKSRPL